MFAGRSFCANCKTWIAPSTYNVKRSKDITILVAPRANLEGGLLQSIVPLTVQDGAPPVQVMERLPRGDETSFNQAGIPSVTVGVVPWEDVGLVKAFLNAEQGQQLGRTPSVAETIHNGCRDSIDAVQETALQTMRRWLLQLVEQYRPARFLKPGRSS